jgi:hypothetical protein
MHAWAGYLNRPQQVIVYPTQANDIHRNPAHSQATKGSTVPLLAALPLYGDAGWIADLHPDRTRTGSGGAHLGNSGLARSKSSALDFPCNGRVVLICKLLRTGTRTACRC